jgi:hypothetical protein
MAKDCQSGDGESLRHAFAISVLKCLGTNLIAPRLLPAYRVFFSLQILIPSSLNLLYSRGRPRMCRVLRLIVVINWAGPAYRRPHLCLLSSSVVMQLSLNWVSPFESVIPLVPYVQGDLCPSDFFQRSFSSLRMYCACCNVFMSEENYYLGLKPKDTQRQRWSQEGKLFQLSGVISQL